MRHTSDDFRAADISPDVLTPVLDASPRLHSMSLMGVGEPLLNNNLCDILRSLKNRMPPTAQVGLTTNGTLMTGERARSLIDAGINWTCVSLDGATKATTERIRPGLDFDQVVSNIAGLAAYRRESRAQRLWLSSNFVMMEENVREIPAFVKLAASLGLDTVSFSHRRDFRTGMFRSMGEETLIPLFREAKELGSRLGVGITLPPRIRPWPEPQCQFLEIAYVRLSGDVVPCCRMLDGATPGPAKIFGNVKKTPLFDIWNSDDYRVFRRRVIEGDLPDECHGCDYSRGMIST
jgi:radical SAM protein with 4Fe4S-binding SPASM domain